MSKPIRARYGSSVAKYTVLLSLALCLSMKIMYVCWIYVNIVLLAHCCVMSRAQENRDALTESGRPKIITEIMVVTSPNLSFFWLF